MRHNRKSGARSTQDFGDALNANLPEIEESRTRSASAEKLSSYIRGWMNYYGLSKLYGPLPELDEWIRRRVRMCYMKQWRLTRTRIRNLLKLGASKSQAIPVGMSSKGPWKLARTYATQLGMNNAWVKEQGLVSVRDLWIAFHYPK